MTTKKLLLKEILFHHNKPVDALLLALKQQQGILERIKLVLPINLAEHVIHCVQKNNKVLVFTDSANWASQLRFYAEAIHGTLTKAVPLPVKAIQIKVIDLPKLAPKPSRKVKIPSWKTIDAIRNQSLLITDPNLRQALNRLSNTLERLK